MGVGASSELALQLPCSSAAPEEEEVAFRSSRILCFGDSLTAGFCNSGTRFSPYGEALQEALNSLGFECEVSINGLSGHRADQMVAELDAPVCRDICGKVGKGLAHILDKDGPYDLVIIMAGTNDFAPNVNLPAVQSSVAKLHDACHARGVPTVMLAAPCNTQNLRIGLSQILRTWSDHQDQVLTFVDPEEVIPRRTAAYWERDCVHFTPSGSRALGLYLAPAIAQILRKLGQQPVGPSHLAQVQPVPQTVQEFHKGAGSHQWMTVPAGWPSHAARGGA